MRESKAERAARLTMALSALGFSVSESMQLQRIERALGRWYALECGDGNDYASWAIERDENGEGKPYLVTWPHKSSPNTGESYRRPVRDREAGAKKRLARIMAGHGDLWAYVQTDPRGCALYVGRKTDVNGHEIETVYNRGVAACVD